MEFARLGAGGALGTDLPGSGRSAEVYTNLIEMRMVGECPELGEITVTLNPDCLSTGQIRTPFDPYAGEGPSAKACRMAVGAIFDMPKLGLKLINKEPIILDHRRRPPDPAGRLSRQGPDLPDAPAARQRATRTASRSPT